MKMALAGKFLSVFLFWGCAQVFMVTPGLIGISGVDGATQLDPGLVTKAQADPVAQETGRSDSVRVLPDNFLSGNAESARPEDDRSRPVNTPAVKPENARPENASPRQQVLFAKPEAVETAKKESGQPDAGGTESGQPKEALEARPETSVSQGASVAPEVGVSPAPVASVASESPSGLPAEAGWDLIPAGARPAYMGIHGGTMPVSLLVSNDGNSLLTFVGRTGNDFLDMLRRTELPLPSLFNSTEGRLPVDFQAGLAGARVLSAGSGQYRMPVLYLTADAFARIAPTPDMLQPFGLSDKPLALEGEVLPPDKTTPAKQFRMFFQPQYLQPNSK